MIKTVVLSSLQNVFPDSVSFDQEISEVTAFRNEPVSFQVAYKNISDKVFEIPFNVRIDSELDVTLYSVGCVPVLNTLVQDLDNPPKPGMYPDMLLPKRTNPKLITVAYPWKKYEFEDGEQTLLHAVNQSWQSIWLTVNNAGKVLTSGKYDITLRFTSRIDGEEVAKVNVTVNILNAKLPKQKLLYTNWFHCDCLCDYYGVTMFSDRHFEIIGNYAKAAAMNGMNMILTPAFTPPLDTPLGAERKTAQLVRVTLNNGEYSFDFSLLKRFIDVCHKAGIEYFEHNHLFTQWGAVSTPKIIAVKDGIEKQIFGWNTKSTGKSYRKFLKAYIPALLDFLRKENLSKKIFFHMSDEPAPNNEKLYSKAVSALGGMLDGYMSGDALSAYLFFEKGYVKTPIVVTSDTHNFIGKCPNMWCYYTGTQLKDGLSNRLITTTPERNRIIGVQMYYFRIKGFLHWGYNYYYEMLSQGIFDPKITPAGYETYAGTSYFVYPWFDGTALESTRQKVFYEAINDMRALEALEKLRGRKFCEQIITEHFGEMSFHTCPESPEIMLQFRDKVNKAVAECSDK